MPRSVSLLFSPFLPSFCRIRSIRFALLNYLIRTHPSRWASRSLINSIPAFSHPGAVRLCRLRLSIFPPSPSCRSPSASVLQGCLLDFLLSPFFYSFLSPASRQIVGTPSCLRDSFDSDFGKCTVAQSHTISGYHFVPDP